MLQTIIGKLKIKNNNNMNPDVTQLERNNNKYYVLTFRYI